jgi:hypothetical protein
MYSNLVQLATHAKKAKKPFKVVSHGGDLYRGKDGVPCERPLPPPGGAQLSCLGALPGVSLML